MLPPLAVERAVGQSDTGPHLPGHLGVAGFQHLALRDRKEHLHRVVFDHCREHTGIRTDQIAGRDGGASDPAADRALDLGVRELDLRVAEVRLGLHDGGFGLTLLGGALVQLGDRRVALAGEFGGACQLLIGVGERRLGGGELRLALVDRGFERFLLDREHDLALFDLVAVLEQAGTEETLHPRPQIDLFERLRASDKLGLFGHGPQLGRRHEHCGRRTALLRQKRADRPMPKTRKKQKKTTRVSSRPPPMS